MKTFYEDFWGNLLPCEIVSRLNNEDYSEYGRKIIHVKYQIKKQDGREAFIDQSKIWIEKP